MATNRRTLKLIKGISAILYLALLASIPFALISYAALKEKDRRTTILDRGAPADAIVTESARTLRSCRFRYQYSFDDQSFSGGEGGCPLVSSHPTGSALKIRVDPGTPNQSVPIGGTLWPGWAIVPVLLAPPILLMLGIGAYAVVRNPRRPQKKRSIH